MRFEPRSPFPVRLSSIAGQRILTRRYGVGGAAAGVVVGHVERSLWSPCRVIQTRSGLFGLSRRLDILVNKQERKKKQIPNAQTRANRRLGGRCRCRCGRSQSRPTSLAPAVCYFTDEICAGLKHLCTVHFLKGKT
jgi:hypothetical protein